VAINRALDNRILLQDLHIKGIQEYSIDNSKTQVTCD
jgi:hypothetical protein